MEDGKDWHQEGQELSCPVLDVSNVIREALESECPRKADIPEEDAACECEDPLRELDAKVELTAAPDMMSAHILIVPPKKGGRAVTEEDILEKLRENCIVDGVKQNYIYRLTKHTVYNRAFIIAQGEEPIRGEDAKLKYHFKRMEEPAELYSAEDYAQIQYTSVKSGDLLGEIVPAGLGRNGWNILGETIPGTNGKKMGDISGSNTSLTGLHLYSCCDGLVSVREGKIYVHRAMALKGLENEKIVFDGTVFVDGNLENSTVEAQGDIIVKGSAQNARIKAGGNVILCKGVTGKNSKIEAGGNVRSYFIENAKVEAGGNVTADVIMLADIACEGHLRLSGRRATLMGGTYRIGGDVYTKNIGNDAHIPTEVILEGQMKLQKKKQKALARIENCRDANDKLMQAMKKSMLGKNEAQRLTLTHKVAETRKNLEEEIKSQEALVSRIEREENQSAVREGKIVVKGKLNPNVILSIDGVNYKNEKGRSYCTVVRQRAELVFRAV